MENVIIFSDLDATLLDHNNYSFEAAKPALELIANGKIPLILSSSKSLAEIKEVQNELGLRHPVIVENGGAICIPPGYFTTNDEFEVVDGFLIRFLGPSYTVILQTLKEIKGNNNFSFKGFNDKTVEEVMTLTDLPLEKAQQAKTRLCSEPIIWEDTIEKLKEFENLLKRYSYKLLKGGRFYHLMGNTDKGNGVRHLMRFYREKYPKNELVTIGVGDSPNDIDMLKAVNIPILVKRPDNTYIDIPFKDKVVYADGIGPVGWNQSIYKILTENFSLDD